MKTDDAIEMPAVTGAKLISFEHDNPRNLLLALMQELPGADEAALALGWPPRVQLRKRNYRGRKLLEKFKSAALRRAIKARSEKPVA